MVKKVVLSLVAVLAAFLVFVAAKSPHYEISREISIHAPAEKIFPYLNSQKLAESWGPWVKIDPATKRVYSGPDAGVGARSSWEGGKQLGTGSATIVESVPNQLVRIRLEYTRPMAMTQDSDYLIRAAGPETIVTWKVTGENSFLGRLMCTFVNLDKTIGGMFETGLSDLKTLVEKSN